MTQFDPLANDPARVPPLVDEHPADVETTPRLGPGWDATLAHRQMGTEPGFIGHNETIEAFRAREQVRERAEREAAAAATEQPTDVPVWQG